jgi:arsenate reductase
VLRTEGGMSRIYNVLFLCTGNSARSILAEAILNKDGAGRFRAFSAGSQPKGQVHPAAPPLDFVFTVCDNAAGETCPIWPGQPMTAHWGIEDPAAIEGDRQPRAFRDAYHALQRRIGLFLSLPIESIDELSLQTRLREIGRQADQHAA